MPVPHADPNAYFVDGLERPTLPCPRRDRSRPEVSADSIQSDHREIPHGLHGAACAIVVENQVELTVIWRQPARPRREAAIERNIQCSRYVLGAELRRMTGIDDQRTILQE